MIAVYGSLRTMPVSQSPLPGPALPVVPPLPTENSPTPRRRRTIVCTNLTINGEPRTLDEAKVLMRGNSRHNDAADIRCERRPGVKLEADYALDVCLSSWCRSCPWQDPAPEPMQRPPMPVRTDGEWDALARRIKLEMARQLLSHAQVGVMAGCSQSMTYKALNRETKAARTLLALAKALGVPV